MEGTQQRAAQLPKEISLLTYNYNHLGQKEILLQIYGSGKYKSDIVLRFYSLVFLHLTRREALGYTYEMSAEHVIS